MAYRERVTIKHVAREAGVSTQTVSRVLNHHPDVAPETRQRIGEIIERLGYHPSALARSLIQQRSRTLGVVIAGLQYLGPTRTLSGIAQQAEEMGYSLLFKEIPHFESNNVQHLLQSLLDRQVDGILWAVPEVGSNRDWLEVRILSLPVPILFTTMSTQPMLSIVAMDNYLGGYLAARHLLDMGYRHIGHLSGPLDWWEAQQRKAGWQDTLVEAGVQVLERHWVQGNWSSASGAEAIEQLIEQYPEMDAVFCANDQMALSVLQVAYQRGRRVPQELGVVGFDGLPETAYFCPPLTTVDQDQHRLGCLAVGELVRLIEAGQRGEPDPQPKSILIQPRLAIRQSTNRNM